MKLNKDAILLEAERGVIIPLLQQVDTENLIFTALGDATKIKKECLIINFF